MVYDYMAYPKNRPALNLVALDSEANLIWTVGDTPIDSPAASYTCIESTTPLIVGNFAGFHCTIDPQCGDLLESRFTK